jgi:hypothetical protein
MQDVIRVTALVGNHELGKEEYAKGTQWNHIKEGLVKKYGQIAAFNIHIPAEIEQEVKR